jgi:hypothetical protein
MITQLNYLMEKEWKKMYRNYSGRHYSKVLEKKIYQNINLSMKIE